MKLFIPAVGYRIRLTEKWEFELYYESRNKSLIELVDLELKDEDINWQARAKHLTASMPAGTLLEIDRVYIRTASKTVASPDDDFDSVTFKVIEHPTLSVKRKITFWAKLNNVNQIDFEIPENFTEGKDKAAAKAKIVKYTPRKIQDELRNLAWQTRTARSSPKWATKKLIAQCNSVIAEYHSLFDPWSAARENLRYEEQFKSLEQQLFSGTLTLPLNLASKIKTMKDLEDSGLYGHYFQKRQQHSRKSTWNDALYKFTHELRSSTKEADGSKWRKFGASTERHHPRGEAAEPQYGHIWIKVKTNAEDTEILEVQAGVDKAEDAKS